MATDSLKKPVLMALAVRPAFATYCIFHDGPFDGYYASFMAFGIVLVDTVLFAWLVREVYRLKDPTSHDPVEAEPDT